MVKRTEILYQPAAGVYTDFESILKKFSQTDTVRYEKFAEIWQEMKMSYFCAGRQNDREVREFLEECFRIAIKFWLPPYNFQVRVGGLYLIYGIYLTQPIVPKVRVRVTPSQWQSIREFQTEAHQQQHWDVDFVFQKLILNHAFDFVATEMECYPTFKDVISEEIAIPEEFKEETSILYDLFSGDILEQFSSIHQHYHKMKVSLEGPNAYQPSRSLDVINSDLVSGVANAISHYQERRKSHNQHTKKIYSQSDSDDENLKSSPEEDGDPDYTPWTISSRKSKIKAKAFKQVAKAHRSRRHRQALKEHSSKRKSKKSKNLNSEDNSDLTSDLNTSTATEEDIDKEGEIAVDNTAIISMPTLMEEVHDEQGTTGKGKKRSIKTDGDLSSKNKSPKKRSITWEIDQEVPSPNKIEKSSKKRGVTLETDEEVSSPKKKRKTGSQKNKQNDKQEIKEKKSPKKKQNKSYTDEETEEGIEKSKGKKQTIQKKRSKTVSENIESVNDELRNSQEKVAEGDTKKTTKKTNKTSKSKTEESVNDELRNYQEKVTEGDTKKTTKRTNKASKSKNRRK